MSRALTILGCEDVFHGVTKTSHGDWAAIASACDATFSVLPSYRGKPFTRAEWDEVFGPCDSVADIGAMFARELVSNYPETKVVLVHRDFDAWSRSMDTIINIMFNPAAAFIANYIEPMMGSARALGTSRNILLGWAGTLDVEEMKRKRRDLFDAHYRDITKMVAPGKLLHYRMGDGWEPLCEFLGVPVPDEPFPHLNESEEMKRLWKEGSKKQFVSFAWFLMRYAVPAALAIGAGAWMYERT